MSYSGFKKLPNNKDILNELLKRYCKRRRKIYDKLGYSNITIQALYDSGASRKKGTAGILKVTDLINRTLNNMKHLKTIEEVENNKAGYFLPDKGDRWVFKAFCKKQSINYRFGKEHQNKDPDVVLKYGKHIFIIEAKHIKESGGAQDKQIVETVEFIRYSENSKYIHYVSFMDGIYFNNFVWSLPEDNTKINKQKKDIERYLRNNPINFFVNTAGFTALLKDM